MEMLISPATKNSSWLGRSDPRVKIVALVGFIGIMSSAQSITALFLGNIFLVLLGASAGISPWLFLKRLLWVVPFGGIMVLLFPFIVPGTVFAEISLGPAVLAMSCEGLSRAAVLTLRMFTGLFALTLLTSTTSLREIMLGLRRLHVPYIFVAMLEFTVRYIFVLFNELNRMTLARKARGFEQGRSLLHRRTFATLGSQAGVLFLRASDRGDRIYRAMLSRGYGGKAPAKFQAGLKFSDVGWGLGMLVAAVFLQILGAGDWDWQWLLQLK